MTRKIDETKFNKKIFGKLQKIDGNIGNLDRDFIEALSTLLSDLNVYCSTEEATNRYLYFKWIKYKDEYRKCIIELLSDDLRKKEIENLKVNQTRLSKIIEKRYLIYLNTIEENSEKEEKKKFTKDDIDFKEMNQYWMNFLKSVFFVIGLEREIHQDIVLENIQKKWY